MSTTAIEWADTVWNPVIGCTRVSEGCRHCYAEWDAARKSTNPSIPVYAGLSRFVGPKGNRDARWSGEVRLRPEKLTEPLRWRKPQRVFVNSMSDLFHADVPDEYIAAVFGVMAACPQHVFLVLTKRAERLRRWFEWVARTEHALLPVGICLQRATHHLGENWRKLAVPAAWPLPNVHLGVSVEGQATADERIPLLLDTPAAVRWVSAEPLLGPVDLTDLQAVGFNAVYPTGPARSRLDWVVVGGESGNRARPCGVEWIRDVVRQCRKADVPCFVKQLGANSSINSTDSGLVDRKGGDPSEWPDDLRVQEFPA